MRADGTRTLGEVLAGIFDDRPRPTGNPDVDELRLYNYQAQACDECGAKPAHRHGSVYHCRTCCHRNAQQQIAAAERAQGRPPL